MQINLVFPPFVLPVTPPLGIAYLKSYLNEKIPYCTVNCIDINLILHNDFFEGIHSTSEANESGSILDSIDILNGNRKSLFFEKKYYHNAAGEYYNFTFVMHNFYIDICKKYIEERNSASSKKPEFLKKYVPLLLKDNPIIIGFTVMMFEQLYPVMVLADLLKEADRNVKIILGGPFLTREVEKIAILNSNIDFIIHGEGEKVLCNLIRNMGSPENVKGIVFLRNNEIIDTGYDQISNLDEIPFPDFSDYSLNKYLSPFVCLPLLASRGCYWRKCSFCVHHYNYRNNYRVRSVPNIIEEIKIHYDKGVSFFNFVDEMISANRFRNISDSILLENMTIYYYALAKPTANFDKETLGKMAKSGCRAIIWGVETFCQRLLDLMDKGTNCTDISEVLRQSHDAGIKNHIFLIVGFPTESKSEFYETREALERNRLYIDSIHWSTFSLNKGSHVFNNPEKYGIKKVYDKNIWKGSYRYDVLNGLTESEIAKLMQENLGFFDKFNKFSSFLNFFRDHALFIYSAIYKEKNAGAD